MGEGQDAHAPQRWQRCVGGRGRFMPDVQVCDVVVDEISDCDDNEAPALMAGLT